jgi:hypothetical protein
MLRDASLYPSSIGSPLRAACLGIVLAVPVLAPAALALVTVHSLSLSPTEVQSGARSTGTLTLDATPSSPVSVVLFSSKPALATVPAAITMPGRKQTRGFTISTVSGAGGCAKITAAVAGTNVKRSAMLFVRPTNSPGPVTLTLSSNTVVGGSSLTGDLVVTGSSSPGHVVHLSSSNPVVTVPATVVLEDHEVDAGFANFTVGTAIVQSPTCAIITATFQGSSKRALLKLTPIVDPG